jgi:Nucleotide-sugar transporter
MECVRNCGPDDDPKKRSYFEQPVIQTLQMFVGEMGCWLVIWGRGLYLAHRARQRASPLLAADEPTETDSLLARDHDDDDADDEEDPLSASLVLPKDGREHLAGWRVALLALPACCDIAGTTLMNVGLLFVAASIYQMTRGALVLFVGLFSVLFLRRRLGLYKWAALFVVVGGVAVVGLAGALAKDHKAVPKALAGLLSEDAEPDLALRTVVGVLLIAAAQMFTATQFVLEESIMEKYSLEPLKAVGWEGLWGFVVTAICMVILHFAVGRTDAGRYGYFDAHEGLREVWENKAIMVSSVLIMISIG